MAQKRVPLYERLPEIYRIEDEKVEPPFQLKHYLALVEDAYGEIEKNIGDLYRDLFIETCDPWVIPYIGDLLGVSHLQGDPWTLRADVADTIALRRRKGTLACIERLTYNLTRWGVHCVELRENLLWNQHLNHQRPDDGGDPPYAADSYTRFTPVWGGTVPLRDPATLSLLNTPFNPFAHVVDARPPVFGAVRYNLPNLAIFLWRLEDYRVPVSKPFSRGTYDTTDPEDAEATHVVRFDVHPLGEPVRLFNTYQFDPDRDPPVVTELDETPGPIEMARLSEGMYAGRPEKYISVETYDPTAFDLTGVELSDVGLQLHLPEPTFTSDLWPEQVEPLFTLELGFQAELDAGVVSSALEALFIDQDLSIPSGTVVQGRNPRWELVSGGTIWYCIKRDQNGLNVFDKLVWLIRGANLCDWENGLQPPILDREIVVDPRIGRLLIGAGSSVRNVGEDEVEALEADLLLTYTYGAVGPVGAHPITRPAPPAEWQDQAFLKREVNYHQASNDLRTKLEEALGAGSPQIIEIQDSMTHQLNIDLISGVINEAGGMNYPLANTLILRAADGQRPVIQLQNSLRFCPQDISAAAGIMLRLEGLYISRDESNLPADEPLIARAAVNRLELIDCTLDPGGSLELDGSPEGTRRAIRMAMHLETGYGYTGDDVDTFGQIPEIVLQRTIAGPLLIDRDHRLTLIDSILDAGKGVGEDPLEVFGLTSATDPSDGWSAPTEVRGLTVFGRMRVERLHGRGGIWVHALEVLNNQVGCIRYSYFSGVGDRLPQNLGCVEGVEAPLHFVSEVFGNSAYGQLARSADFRIRERGPGDDAMGAFGFLYEAHKWRNLQIRFREFMPVAVRPLLVPVT